MKNPTNVSFASAGEYVASLTLIDAANNHDPSPPTRRIKVLPASANFDISVTPALRTIVPGQSTTYTVTVTPLKGFSGNVALTVGSESGLPAGMTSGGFSPATIPGSGSSTLTMNTTPSTIPYATSLTMTGTSGGTSHTAAATLAVNLAPPSGLVATTADSLVILTWNSVNGATGYRVGRSLSGSGFKTLACPTGHSYSDTSVQNGVTYHYAVTAVFTTSPDGGGASSESAEILATPPCPLPSFSGALFASKAPSGDTVWSWTPGGASAFDLLRGDLTALRATGGDFGAALDALPAGESACLADDTAGLSVDDTYADPAPNHAVFTLVRAVTTSCLAEGTLDEGVAAQIGSRDAEVAGSARACP